MVQKKPDQITDLRLLIPKLSHSPMSQERSRQCQRVSCAEIFKGDILLDWRSWNLLGGALDRSTILWGGNNLGRLARSAQWGQRLGEPGSLRIIGSKQVCKTHYILIQCQNIPSSLARDRGYRLL